MTESAHTRNAQIFSYLNILVDGHASKEHYLQYKPFIDTITRRETIYAVDQIMQSSLDIDQVKTGVNKFVTGISSTLLKYPTPQYPALSVLSLFSMENEQIKGRMADLKPFVQLLNKGSGDRAIHMIEITQKLKEMQRFSYHYTKLQNILFPAVESQWPDFRCTQLMWSYHDDIVTQLKQLIDLAGSGITDITSFNRILGRFYFDVYAMIFREEHILFPEIHESLGQDLLEELYGECFEIGFSFITPPLPEGLRPRGQTPAATDAINLSTGILLPDQLNSMLNALPCDVTYVDEYDKVAYFSGPHDRIFPRSAAIIGRKVQNCHPPESAHVVQQILDSFRSGSEDTADFWIDRGEGKVLIRYFALRDEKGAYRGTLEVTQDITALHALTGEKRLLKDT